MNIRELEDIYIKGEQPDDTKLHNNTRFWTLKGRLHRTDGPAVINSNGRPEFYFYGREIPEELFDRVRHSCEVTKRGTEEAGLNMNI